MAKKSYLLAFIIVFSHAGFLFADSTLIGTTANNFLKILAPAKPAAMGEAYVALADDSDAFCYNPAGLGRSMSSEFSYTHIEWLGQVKYENLNILLPFNFGNIAFSANGLHFTSSMANTTPIPVPPYYVINYHFSPYSIIGSAAFAREFAENIFVGINLKIMNYSIDPEADNGSALSFAADFGLIYDMPFLKGLAAGLTFRNLGPSTAFAGSSDMQPIDIRGGVGYDGKFFTLEADAQYITDNDINYFLGASVTLFDMLSLRAGWKGGTINQPTFGAGFEFAQFRVDYAFVPFNEEDLGIAHRFTLSYRFGAPPANLKFKPPVFSPNRDKYLDYSTLQKEVVSQGKVKSYSLKITDANGAVIKQYPSLKTGIKMFWNGLDNLNMITPDGDYYAVLGVDYGGGIKSESNKAKVEVDNTPPTINVDANPKIIKPGAMTTLMCPVTFSPSLFDLHGIGKWKLVITSADGKLFKTFSGTGEPLEIVWDGTDDSGLISVKTGATYGYTFYATDTVGNMGRSSTQNVKVLLREIVITLASDTLFDIGKADVKISVYSDLKQISEQIKGLGNPSVIVEGHTDNQPIRRGAYADNQVLSEARAKAVVKFFAELFNMNIRIFTPVGKGDTQPIATNDTPEGRKKNRRVTIRIQASKWE